MKPFICQTCGSETWKLIAPVNAQEFSSSQDKLACPRCFNTGYKPPSYLHQKMEGAQARGLTEAKSRIIANRIICPEDHAIVIDKRTGRETQY
jgi:hypothetical protein